MNWLPCLFAVLVLGNILNNGVLVRLSHSVTLQGAWARRATRSSTSTSRRRAGRSRRRARPAAASPTPTSPSIPAGPAPPTMTARRSGPAPARYCLPQTGSLAPTAHSLVPNCCQGFKCMAENCVLDVQCPEHLEFGNGPPKRCVSPRDPNKLPKSPLESWSSPSSPPPI